MPSWPKCWGGRPPTAADLPRLKLTRRIVEETMRLYPPAPGLSARVAVEADEVAGTSIPAGGMVLISSWILHRHRSLWEDPNRSTRIASCPSAVSGGPGSPICRRRRTARLHRADAGHERGRPDPATLAQRFRLRMVPGHQVAIQHRITIRPRGGLPMLIARR
ncbi:MAG: cytochrome P450 [Caulobacteraceae bacterium]